MELRLKPVCEALLLLLLGMGMHSAIASTNRCNKNIRVMATTSCHSCSISHLVECPVGFSKTKPGKGNEDCRYHIHPVVLSFKGCSHECYKDVEEPGCCPGYWGEDCMACPESPQNPCNSNGICSDGIGGNGTCTCKPGFAGTACESCAENRYGPTCSSVCTCKNGLCNADQKGDGRCTCFSGYRGSNCDQELPGCSNLRCGPNARCAEDFALNKLVCKCMPGYLGDGVQCMSINPCLRTGPCHARAACLHVGPNQHTCTCERGYSGDGVVCMPVDPCQTHRGGCSADSTQCVYDGPGQSHCVCLPGFDSYEEGVGCRLKDMCNANSCHKNANCTTVHPGKVECKCHEGYLGNGKICFGNIMQRLQELNSDPDGKWTNQLSSSITLFEAAARWPLTSLGPFTLFVPINKGFKGTSISTLVSDEPKASYLSKLHMVAGEITFGRLKKGGLFYTLTGKSGETIEEEGQVKFRIHGSRRKGTILQSDIIASNGMIHIVSKPMESVPPTVKSEREENLMKILSDNGKFSQFKALFEKTILRHLLDGPGPYTVFAPTNIAFSSMREGYLDYLDSDAGQTKLLELLRNHVIISAELGAASIASIPKSSSMANQILSFNVTDSGQVTVNGQAVLEMDVEAKNGRLYSLEGVLIPSTIEPVLPHRCDLTKRVVERGPCVSCSLVSKATCLNGIATGTFSRGCLYNKRSRLAFTLPILGCSALCNVTKTSEQCCKGFFGPECMPCPGGFTTPCSSHGQCTDGIEGSGTCVCEPNFKGSRCQYCANPTKFGPACDKTCGCVQGVCDNRPESDGSCKPDSCKEGFSGKFCERHIEPCGASVQYCHAHALCDYNGGAVMCVCKPGFQGDGIICVEADPCARPYGGACSANAKCVKTGVGTHECQCLSGWREDGDDCEPINACLDPSRGGCHSNATCIYVGPGQSDCACKSGYRGNGKECEAINQCVAQEGGCHYLATCQFLPPGSWTCVCEEGYAGNGRLCYGTVAQEVAANPELKEFNEWVNKADLSQLLAESQNITVFVPTSQAITKMTQDDKDFWLASSNLPSLVRSHIIPGVFALSDLRRSNPFLQLTSLLRRTIPVFWTNETMSIGGAMISSANIAAKNGLIHLIDTVLMADHKLSEGLLEVLGQAPEFSIFRSYLIQYNLTDNMEEMEGFTVFAPTDNAIKNYLKLTGQSSMDANVTQYHVVLGEALRQSQLLDGLYMDTMLGFSYQLGLFRRDGKLFVNDVLLNVTDILCSKGVVHGLSAVLAVPSNRCDKASYAVIMGRCMDCFHSSGSLCPHGLKQLTKRRRCMYSRVFQGDNILTMGCKASCQRRTIDRQCCAGYYGMNCERCPGPEGSACFGNGDCTDGVNGTGQCVCFTGFNGTACENCQPGKYGIHCDQACACVNGRCNDGIAGDGTCECDVGWRGISCSLAITTDSCGGKCHSSANCLLKVADGSNYCSCAAGFQGNGTYCTAVDACEKNNGGCSVDAVCKRTLPGRRKCMCNPGFFGDGFVCVSINPCLEGNGSCHASADCIHTGPNKTACVCKKGFSGDGKNLCTAINVCSKKNGGCHRFAKCAMTVPGERNCTCLDGYIGDGENCKGTVHKEILIRKLRDFYLALLMSDVPDLKGRGPFTVFAPNEEAFKQSEKLKDSQLSRTNILRYHIVACCSLQAVDLRQPRNLTTIMGDTLQITYSQDTIYINNKAKVVYSDEESVNGIFHEIDSVLIPPSMNLLVNPKTALNLSDLGTSYGFNTFLKLLEDTEVMKLVADPIHQPVTLFLPTDSTMAALPQEQKDFLYGLANRDQLVEYLKYHILRDTKIFAAELMHSTNLKTLQGSNLEVSCSHGDRLGDLYVNDKSCRIVNRHLIFNGGIAYGIDCLLTPPSLGGRCDHKDTIDIELRCGMCRRVATDCPAGSKKKTVEKCDLPHYQVSKMSGCKSVCTMIIWKPKCCAGYYGRDCLACPGGPGAPCSNHGKCDEDHLGNGTCTCEVGFGGVACELCEDGRFGPDCKACNCSDHGICDQSRQGTGSCFCAEGWTGARCDIKAGDEPQCSPVCSQNAVCRANNTCVCKPFFEGDGVTCTASNLCKYWNGGCAKVATCNQTDTKVSCTCPKGYKGDGFVCTAEDPCTPDDNGCHEHATCIMTAAGKKKCECKANYIGDGMVCAVKQKPVNRCIQDNGQCHVDAQCTDLHYEDTTVGVFHYRSTQGTYKLNNTRAKESCSNQGATIATYIQLSYAQQAGFHLCAAGWLDEAHVAYPTTFSNPKCGFGHVGIVDYGKRSNLSETWDAFCFRLKDVKCECKPGYIGDGYSCTGNLLQVLSTSPTFSNFLSQILNFSQSSSAGKEFVNHLSNINIRATLFVPENGGLFENETLSFRDIQHHLLEGQALILQDLINVSHVRSRLGNSLKVVGVPSLENPKELTALGYVNDRFVIKSDIVASNGIIHVLQGPLKAPPPPPSKLQAGHKAGMGIGVVLLVLLVSVASFVGYNFYTHKTKPFQFHYFKEDEGEDVSQAESVRNITNPMYEAGPMPSEPAPAEEEEEEDKHQVVASGSYDLLQDS